MFVALGEVRDDIPEGGQRAGGGAWIMAAAFTGCSVSCDLPDAYGMRYLLKQNKTGAW